MVDLEEFETESLKAPVHPVDRDHAVDILLNYLDDRRASLPDDVRIAIDFIAEENEKENIANRSLHIKAAVTYIAWCRAGHIIDKRPLAAVRDAYGLTDTDTVKKWVMRYTAGYSPARKSVVAAELVQAYMQLSGIWYQEL